MRMQRKKVIALITLLFISIICCLWLFQTEETPITEGPQQADQRTEKKLFTLSDVNSIYVKNQAAKYQLDRVGDHYRLAGEETNNIDQDKVEAVANALTEVTISKDLGAQENLEQFGLTKEQAVTVLLVGDDGRKEQYLIGSLMPDTVFYCYLWYRDSVYAVRAFPEEVFAAAYAYYDLVLIQEGQSFTGEQEVENAVLTDFKLEGTHIEQPVVIYADETVNGGYVMTEPAYAEAMFAEENDAGDITVLQALSHLEALQLIDPKVDGGMLDHYGLASPYAQVTYTLNGQGHRIRVSKRQEDGTRYLMVDEDTAVYKVADESVRVWAESTAMDYRPSYLWLVKLLELEQVTLSYGGGEYRYQMNSRKEEADTDILEVWYQDTKLDRERVWQPFYQTLLGMAVMDMPRVQIEEETPVLKITYHYQEEYGKTDVEAAFYPVEGSDRYAATLNGKYAGILRKSTVEEVVELAEKVKRNEEIQ